MTRTRKTLAWVVGIFFLLVAVLVVILATFDWNRIKPTINTKVSDILHRPFAINGNLAVTEYQQQVTAAVQGCGRHGAHNGKRLAGVVNHFLDRCHRVTGRETLKSGPTTRPRRRSRAER